MFLLTELVPLQSFVPNATAHGVASTVGRCTLFEITTKELIDLSELHHDIMHVLLAWLSQTLAESTKTMIAPLLSPTTASAPPCSGKTKRKLRSSGTASASGERRRIKRHKV